jgi:hypothetical protein
MKNLWIHTDDPFVTWRADLTEAAARPGEILAFVRAALLAGARHQMFDVAEAPVIGYNRERDGQLGDVLARTLERDRVLDLFGFTGAAMLPGHPKSSIVETRLCYYDRDNQLVEEQVTDQGALLAALEPAPGSIPKSFMMHYPPIRVTGRRYTDVRDGVSVERGAYQYAVDVRFCIHSDIWFPWIYGSAHPDCDHRRMFDNRALALCHTPRLNAFLADVADAARKAGGYFEFRPDESVRAAVNWVDGPRVLLDWMPSDGIMPPELLDAAWT